jgi:hypothetical protein
MPITVSGPCAQHRFSILWPCGLLPGEDHSKRASGLSRVARHADHAISAETKAKKSATANDKKGAQ